MVALGILVFALFAIVALLPVGIQTNQTSSDNAEAANILTAVEIDLRNTCPAANFNGFTPGRSQLFNLALPYVVSSGRTVLNYSLSKPGLTTTVTSMSSSGYTTGLDDTWKMVPVTTARPSRFQVSVIYTAIPPPGSLAPIEARLIVNWPAISGDADTVADLTRLSKVRGFVQSYVTFKAP